jgi:two-component system sensor histidine kinase CreC
MSIRLKIFLAFFILFAVGIFQLTRIFKTDVRKSYLESLEENMVDTANILAEFVAADLKDSKLDTANLHKIFDPVAHRRPDARIYNLFKDKVDAGIYITDAKGKVLFDSKHPENIGNSMLRWNDVTRTLRGEYGARSTRLKKDDPSSSIMHVAAPIMNGRKIIGVLTFYKPIKFTTVFINERRNNLVTHAVIIILIAVFIFIIAAEWVAEPVVRLTKYVVALKHNDRAKPPRLRHGEVGKLLHAFEELREELEGKNYVENYVQTLTHELKTPISGIRGAVELLETEQLTPEQNRHFINNIHRENDRMSRLVERLLHLARLEGRRFNEKITEFNLSELLQETVNEYRELFPKRQFEIIPTEVPVIFSGERFLIKEAVSNLIRNAVDFTENTGKIEVSLLLNDGSITIAVKDNGTGIPEYALERILEKFYSLPRPDGGRKSSGLGLSIVHEIAKLHNGSVDIKNNSDKGAQAFILLPKND